MRRALLSILLCVVVAALAGCGDGPLTSSGRHSPRERAQDTMGRLPPSGSHPVPRRRLADPIETFEVAVLKNVDDFWTQTYRRAGLPPPRVGFVSVKPHLTIRTP